MAQCERTSTYLGCEDYIPAAIKINRKRREEKQNINKKCVGPTQVCLDGKAKYIKNVNPSKINV